MASRSRPILRDADKELTVDVLLHGAFDSATQLGFAAVGLGDAPYLDNFHVLERARGSGLS